MWAECLATSYHYILRVWLIKRDIENYEIYIGILFKSSIFVRKAYGYGDATSL